MSTTTRAILIGACVIALLYLAVQFGTGVHDDPRMQADPPVSTAPDE